MKKYKQKNFCLCICGEKELNGKKRLVIIDDYLNEDYKDVYSDDVLSDDDNEYLCYTGGKFNWDYIYKKYKKWFKECGLPKKWDKHAILSNPNVLFLDMEGNKIDYSKIVIDTLKDVANACITIEKKYSPYSGVDMAKEASKPSYGNYVSINRGSDGTTYYDEEGLRHRIDGPAVVYDRGDYLWYKHGLLHREDGPAREWYGDTEWYKDGKKHRLDGPAIENHDNSKEWWENGEFIKSIQNSGLTKEVKKEHIEYTLNGKLHNDNGPAIIWHKGNHVGRKEWWKNDQLHRESGPAIIRGDGRKEWWIEDKSYSEYEFNKIIENRNKKADEHAKQADEVTCQLAFNGAEFRNSSGKLHNDNGPAIVHNNGDKFWYKNDKPHRDNDLPAIELADGTRCWWVDGKRHRTNGPASEFKNGSKEWWVDGKLTKHMMGDGVVRELTTNSFGDYIRITKNGVNHCENGPAIQYVSGKIAGTKIWWKNGRIHREDGPATMNYRNHKNTDNEYFINGKKYSYDEFKKQIELKNIKTETKPEPEQQSIMPLLGLALGTGLMAKIANHKLSKQRIEQPKEAESIKTETQEELEQEYEEIQELNAKN